MRAFERFLLFQPITFAELSNRRERRWTRERKSPRARDWSFILSWGGRSTRFNGALSDAAPPWITYDDPKRYRNVVHGKTLISLHFLFPPLDAFLSSLRVVSARIRVVLPHYSPIFYRHVTAKLFAKDVNRGRPCYAEARVRFARLGKEGLSMWKLRLTRETGDFAGGWQLKKVKGRVSRRDLVTFYLEMDSLSRRED